MAVEISYYDVRLVSLSQCRESEWFMWSFVHGVYKNSLVLLGLCIGVFIGDNYNGNDGPCTILIVWMLC